MRREFLAGRSRIKQPPNKPHSTKNHAAIAITTITTQPRINNPSGNQEST
jgi:hypothetical protein